jgi:FtsP/CotA-like multicopper oxidase with cupredoxin domain
VAPTVHPDGLVLDARPGTVSWSEGQNSPAWLYNDGLPGPTLRVRRGERVRSALTNGLGEDTIVHWHGLDVPQEADGHPRLAVPSGARYDYDYVVTNRAGTYWYHPHPHMRTAPQVHLGMAGFYLVGDGDEDALGLPSGERDVPLVIQDKRLDTSGNLVYEPTPMDLMVGYMGDTPFVNGAPDPYLLVDRTLYRFRILNGSNARIFDLALNTEAALALIGTDGGLLNVPAALTSIFLGPAERVDVLIDFSGHAPGDLIRLQSRPFSLGGPPSTQGQPMDLMRFSVTDREVQPASAPSSLVALPPAPDFEGAPRQTFEFRSHMMRHFINGVTFDMERVDAQIPLGEPQVWTFSNVGAVPHPVHAHGGQFRVLSRSGGRGQVFPWERGLKDTVLLMALETVEVAVHFPEHRGLFLLHCHNLEHEDDGMMINFEVA